MELIKLISARSRLPIAGLINNTNLQDDTTAADVLEGQQVLEQVSARTGLPISAIYATQGVMDTLPEAFRSAHAHQLQTLVRRMRPDFL